MQNKTQFIVFEGPDKAGKSTIIDMLKEDYPDIIYTREPGGLGDKTCEKIREVIKDETLEIDPICETYLFAASRARHSLLIQRLIEEGKTILTDRFIESSLVYQGLTRNIPVEMVNQINKYATNGLWPNVVFYFKIDIETYLKRKGTPQDRLEKESVEFFENIINNYDRILKYESQFYDVITIDATKSKDEVYKDVKQNLDKYINKKEE